MSSNILKVRQGVSPSRAPSSLAPSPSLLKERQEKKSVPSRKTVRHRQAAVKDFSSQMKSLLRVLFKCTSVYDKSTEHPHNFPNASGVITLVRNTGGNLKVWDYLVGAKDTFPNIRMIQKESPVLRKMSNLVSLHPSFSTDASRIVSDGRISTDIGTGNFGQSVGPRLLQIRVQSAFKVL